jgi:hypothetical protein
MARWGKEYRDAITPQTPGSRSESPLTVARVRNPWYLPLEECRRNAVNRSLYPRTVEPRREEDHLLLRDLVFFPRGGLCGVGT